MDRIARCQAGLLLAFAAAGAAQAQQNCQDTPEGRICQVQQPLTAGAAVDLPTQKLLGLVAVGGGCSGMLLNQYWVLTARHCVTNPPPNPTAAQAIAAPFLPVASVPITAPWAPGMRAVPARFQDFGRNSGPGVTPAFDMVLIYLGAGDLGPVNGKIPYISQAQVTTSARWVGARLTAADTVTQYGRGLSTFATGVFGGVPPAVPSGGAGTYLSAPFTPSGISDVAYTLAMNAASQVGHGGDSGGPSIVTRRGGIGTAVAGVQSTCTATGYVTNAPARTWQWATGISACQYVPVETVVREIGRAMNETPLCQPSPQCQLDAMRAIVTYMMQ